MNQQLIYSTQKSLQTILDHTVLFTLTSNWPNQSQIPWLGQIPWFLG